MKLNKTETAQLYTVLYMFANGINGLDDKKSFPIAGSKARELAGRIALELAKLGETEITTTNN